MSVPIHALNERPSTAVCETCGWLEEHRIHGGDWPMWYGVKRHQFKAVDPASSGIPCDESQE